jgi:hypothetical protein
MFLLDYSGHLRISKQTITVQFYYFIFSESCAKLYLEADVNFLSKTNDSLANDIHDNMQTQNNQISQENELFFSFTILPDIQYCLSEFVFSNTISTSSVAFAIFCKQLQKRFVTWFDNQNNQTM